MITKLNFFILLMFSCSIIFGQNITLVDSNSATHIRGLSVVSDSVAWVSGNNGMTARSTDGGKSWQWQQIRGFEKTDFRDIEAFDKHTAILMGIGSPAILLRTTDGGSSWQEVYRNDHKDMFLDAMHFWNVNSGIVIGDPVEGKLFIGRTFDGGKTWEDLPLSQRPEPLEGEALFAASGTNIRGQDRDEACFITGGMRSKFFNRNGVVDLPLKQGTSSTGANSIAVRDPGKLKNSRHLVVVGGDFSNDTAREGNCALSTDGGISWIIPATPPFGYRSCVEYLSKESLLACGTSGIDLSDDGGMNWRNISTEGYHVVRKAKKGSLVLLAGRHGRIARYDAAE